jgi:hypothetical protein
MKDTNIEDSLKVSENEDGSFTFEWDKDDPRYEHFNDMTEEQFSSYLNDLLGKYIKERMEENQVE